MDAVSELENALGGELLRVRLLGREPPTLAERYAVEAILGRGASGLVVAGTDVRLNRPVALKIRLGEGDSSALAEARTLARLDHPNVVRVYDVDVVPVQLGGRELPVWVVSMQRVDGRTMRAWLREVPRSASEVLGVLADVGRGLAAAHAERIIHRDVKPENVLVRRDGVAQVLDFGFAVQAASTHAEHGGLRPAAGTDPYMAPEARLGRTSRASDQFSLGVMLVESLTGEPMPAGARVPRGVPTDVWQIARRATDPDPAARFPDLEAMVEAMLEARSRGAAARSRRRAVPVLVFAALAAAVALVLSGRGRPRAHGVPAPVSLAAAAHEARDAAVASRASLVDDRPDAASIALEDAAAPPRDDAAALEVRGDAGLVASVIAGRDAGTTGCAIESGQYRFRAVPDATTGPHGVYVLGIDVHRGRVRDVSLRRTEPRRDQLEIVRLEERDDCTLAIDARAESRDYAFELTIEGRAIRGAFRTSRGAHYAGRVVPDAP